MKIYIYFILLLCLSCRQVETNTPEASATKDEVKATLIAMWDAIEKGDADRYATYVHPNFTQFGETDSLLLVGKDKEVESIRQFTKVATNVHTEMIDPRVTINGNVAWVTYYWKDAGNKIGVPFSSYGKSTRIFVKEDNRWLCIHGHYTLLPFER